MKPFAFYWVTCAAAALLACPFALFAADHEVVVRLSAPQDTPAIYMAGNRRELGDWSPKGLEMRRVSAGHFEARVRVPSGTVLEFKFTRGSWATEAVNEDGTVPANHRVVVEGDMELSYAVTRFRNSDERPTRPTAEGSGVSGTLKYHYDFESSHLPRKRHVAVWLPPGYDADTARTYPVLYMHDGQNIFDPRLAATGVDWGVDEAAVRLIEAGKIPPLIVVGVFNTAARSSEYNPFAEADRYASFLIEELKPMMDRTYRTRPEARYTAVCGSSLGGLVSLYLGWKRPDVFGRVAALSAHINPLPEGFPGAGKDFVEQLKAWGNADKLLRLYVDRSGRGIDATYGPQHEKLREILVDWGWKDGHNVDFKHFPDHAHTEADWRKRMEGVLEFLWADLK